jgi:O-antigen/teichoic acid export membrane protein
MKRIWSLAAAVCLVAAFVFFWFDNFDGVFVMAVLGCLAWLLSYRKETRQRVVAASSEETKE